MRYEVINDGLSVYPNIEEYERVNGVTHYDFQVFQNKDGWGVKAKPYKNWKERMEADMKQKRM